MHKLELPAAPMLCSGHAACPGCVEALSVRHLLAVIGMDAMAVIPPSCMAIIAGAQPYSSLRIPVYQPTLESSAAAASGLRRALDAQGRHETQVIVLAGDGGTYDIGFQCLSSAAERNENILYFCLDNEGYMNTGAQKSSSTPHYAHTSSTPAGKTTRKKNLTEIMAAHQVPYAATASVGYLDDMVRKVEKAKAMPWKVARSHSTRSKTASATHSTIPSAPDRWPTTLRCSGVTSTSMQRRPTSCKPRSIMPGTGWRDRSGVSRPNRRIDPFCGSIAPHLSCRPHRSGRPANSDPTRWRMRRAYRPGANRLSHQALRAVASGNTRA